MKKIWIAIVIIAILAFAIALVVTHAKKEAKDIKVGIILPLTGPGAPYGQAEREGMELAAREANESGGIKGKKLLLSIEDSQTDPATGVAAIIKLIQIDKVKIIIGDLASSVTLAIAPIAEKNKVVLITPGSSSPKISRAGDYIFRLYPSDDYQGKILAEWAFENAIKKVGILYINNDYGVGLKDKFKGEFENRGGIIPVEEAYEQGEKDFRTHLTKLKARDVGGMFIIAAGQENANILIQLKELGINKRVFAPDSFKDENIIKVAGNAAEGVVCSAPSFSLLEKRKVVITFLSDYKTAYKKEPNVFAAYGYDSVSLVSKLVRSYGYDSSVIKNELHRIKFEGVIGEISFDESGDLVPRMEFYIVKDGKFQLLEATK